MDKNYIGIDNKAKKINKWYISRGGVAKNVIKGYIGVNDIAKPLFERKYELSKKEIVINLSKARYGLAATTVGNYALFGGGSDSYSGNYFSTVDIYDNNLVRGAATSLSIARSNLAATTMGNYALFGGGGYYNSNNSYYCQCSNMDVYDNNLIKNNISGLTEAVYSLAATTVGNYALFGGGIYSSSSNNSSIQYMTSYNNNLIKSRVTDLSSGGEKVATTVGNYALFSGGYYGSDSNIVDTYDNNLVKGTASNLSVGRAYLAAITVGNYALFGGGIYNAKNTYSEVDTYDNNLVKGTASNLSIARSNLAGTVVGNYALFSGGSYYNNTTKKYTYYDKVDTYDNNLVKGTATNLDRARSNLAAITVGGYGLFGGGNTTYYGGTVDVYQVKLI